MNWTTIWQQLFGATEWLGVNMGFWVAITVIGLFMVGLNLICWGMKPKVKAAHH